MLTFSILSPSLLIQPSRTLPKGSFNFAISKMEFAMSKILSSSNFNLSTKASGRLFFSASFKSFSLAFKISSLFFKISFDIFSKREFFTLGERFASLVVRVFATSNVFSIFSSFLMKNLLNSIFLYLYG